MLKLSSAAVELIKKQQGLSLEKYRDEHGTEVIGYGHVIQQWEKFHGLITVAEAERLLDNDIQIYETLIQENIVQPLTQHQHDALVLLMFSFSDTPCPINAIAQAVSRV
ncbi:lysozyme [Enterobacter cloacae]|uniref:lysozyme n=1 Tax=Enterobacter cloacae TaxID=550 RepID=UPI001250D0E7|nr:phage-related lysozyme [Enterobacter cloacae]VAM15025.1 phage-related lysozyme [Enterobacter kobei]HCM9561399.1 lysozyme [Enterobacter cloacae subsp. cloacae]HDC4393460.1 lysozyme [Enterobacter cloacae]